jgi:ABC-type nickel/cobalt efflux system permease component RcnA
MGFDDFFENDHKHHKHGYNQRQHHDDYHNNYHDNHHDDDHHMPSYGAYGKDEYHRDYKQLFIAKLQNNPKLKGLIITAAIVLLLIVIIVGILLIPLIIKLFDFVTKNGIQGIIDTLWKGTK